MREQELIKKTLGAYTRLEKEPGERIVNYFYHDRSARTPEQFDGYVKMTMAHVVMLYEQKIIPKADAAAILSALLEVDRMGVENFPLNPKLTETVLQVEAYVLDKVGPEVGGNIHIGRSRCDLSPSISRLGLRPRILGIIAKVIELREALLQKAQAHVHTVMPIYTHMQHAQPITFGHYLISVADALARDLRRLDAAYHCTNASPLGTAATATTSWPLNRERLVELLGFDSLIENSRDAGVAKDYLIETMAAFAALMAHVARTATDLWIWSSAEFGMVELDDEYTGTSSAMPQKKNNYPLEVMRYRYAQVIGDMMTTLAALKGPNSIDSETLLLDTSTEPIMHAAKYTYETVDFMLGVVSTLIVHESVMRERAGIHFAQVLELADVIAQMRLVSWRTAHHIVGKVVNLAIAKGLTARQIDKAMVDQAAVEIVGHPLAISAEAIQRALDPEEFVRRRALTGGPAPVEVERMLAGRKQELADDKKSFEMVQAKVGQSLQGLYANIRAIVG
jgi:argininosuccinate lyase